MFRQRFQDFPQKRVRGGERETVCLFNVWLCDCHRLPEVLQTVSSEMTLVAVDLAFSCCACTPKLLERLMKFCACLV